MNIGLLTQYYKPEMGAPQNRLFEMLSGLKSLGNNVCVVTGMPNYPTGSIFPQYKGKFSLVEKIDDIDIKRYWLFASNSKKTIPRLLNMLSFSVLALLGLSFFKKHRIDYLIVESPPLLLCISAWLISKLTKAKLVTNVSDLWPLSAKELGVLSEKSLVYKILEIIERFIYKKSFICMGQSEQITEYIRTKTNSDVYLFRNGVDPKRFINVNNYNINREKFVIVYAGLLGYAQGIFSICKNINFQELGVEFHIYGAGGEQSQIEEFIQHNSENGIFYHGKVSREEIPRILHTANATLIPLVKVIFGAVPSKIYESMAAGVPILFSGGGEGQKIITDNRLGLCSPNGDYDAMKDNILFMVHNPQDMELIKQNCLRCASEKFNRPKQIQFLNDFLLKKLNLLTN